MRIVPAHAGIRNSELRDRLRQYLDAELLIHPECGCTSRFAYARNRGALDAARTYVLSTEGMVRHAKDSRAPTVLVASDEWLLHRLRKDAPGKTYIHADERAVCRYMKQITLPKLRDSLRDARRCEGTGAPAIAWPVVSSNKLGSSGGGRPTT